MKIVSVNGDQTASVGQIAFNLDEELPPEVRQKLSYGSLSFTGEGRILVVTKDMRDSQPVTPEAIENINAKIAAILAEQDEQATKRQRMLKHIADEAGLPLE